MLTIRHIEPNGYELVQAVESVWRAPKSELKAGQLVFAKIPHEEEPLRFGNGCLYVMNAEGRTVATYRLDDALVEGGGQ